MNNFTNIKNRLLKSGLVNDSFWAVAGNVVGRGFALLASIIIARILGKDVFGEFGIVKSTLVSMAILSTFGLNYTATKYLAEYKKSKPHLLRNVVGIAQRATILVSGIFAILLILFSGPISLHVLDAPQLATTLKIVAVYIVFDSLTRTQIGILAGLGEFKDIARINALIGLLTFIIGVALTYFYGLFGALLTLLIVQMLNCVLNSYITKKKITTYPLPKKNRSLFKEVMNFSIPVALQEALYSIITWSYGLLLIKLSNFGEMGLYAAAMQWNAVILFIPGVLRNVVLSHMSGANDDISKHSKILKTILMINLGITGVISLIFFIFSGFIASFYGENFEGLKTVLNITVFTTIFISLSNVYAQAYMSKNKNWLMLLFRLIRDCSILVLAFILLTKTQGSEGALSLAYSALSANIIFLILMATVYEKKIKPIHQKN